MYVCVYLCMWVCVYVCSSKDPHSHTYTRRHAGTRTHTHIHFTQKKAWLECTKCQPQAQLLPDIHTRYDVHLGTHAHTHRRAFARAHARAHGRTHANRGLRVNEYIHIGTYPHAEYMHVLGMNKYIDVWIHGQMKKHTHSCMYTCIHRLKFIYAWEFSVCMYVCKYHHVSLMHVCICANSLMLVYALIRAWFLHIVFVQWSI
jgi:hypothetical protein